MLQQSKISDVQDQCMVKFECWRTRAGDHPTTSGSMGRLVLADVQTELCVYLKTKRPSFFHAFFSRFERYIILPIIYEIVYVYALYAVCKQCETVTTRTS